MDTKNHIDATLIFLDSIKERPGMYLSNYNVFSNVSDFINGYILALYSIDNKIFNLKNISLWYGRNYYPQATNIIISSNIQNKYPTKNDNELIEIYIDYLVEYFNSFKK
ncbi:hypothetical protein HCB45_07440 [Listeria sp. FSL L7-0091]|uniref:Uncharacterized protein n=1 Tax=Listeria farberi TaxID=2713500 RepID=A0A7X0ZHI1_9LIST|nr:hypothetical protein [Listeria farberi]MBC1374229.1 hypothetical protein [Listeria farberi]MBC1381118.1 hypothetical protein [Listeria farberi]MBC2261426.1 hypothetical protein [Listeria farberi]MBC2267353.1 hypothetical protein [Listeria farberi]MBC2286814.1 hypothetical protein [Listeria farberi]